MIGQPNLEFAINRAAGCALRPQRVRRAGRDRNGGGRQSGHQVLQGEQRYDLVVRYQPPYRNTKEAIERIRLVAPSGERVSLSQVCDVNVIDGASEIYREGNSRYVAIKYSVRGARSGQHR